MSPVKFWIIVGCCWVPQMRTKPVKKIWGPFRDSMNSYYVQRPWKNCQLLQVFWHLNYHILVFFLAYIGIYRMPAGWYGQEPYLGPAHLWLWQNMGVWDKKNSSKMRWHSKCSVQILSVVSTHMHMRTQLRMHTHMRVQITHAYAHAQKHPHSQALTNTPACYFWNYTSRTQYRLRAKVAVWIEIWKR